MKKLLLAASILFGTYNVNAQIPDYGVLSQNIVITDIDGEEYDLYEILDQGKTIILDLFAEWCGPCWNYHTSGQLTNLYDTYGPDGTDELLVMAVETDPTTSVSDLYGGSGTQGWDWFNGITYPIAKQNIGGIFNQSYYPTIVMICPDRSVTEVGQQNTASLYAATQTCAPAPTNTNDPRLLASLSDEFFCQGQSANIIAVLQNYGLEPITSATIEVFDGATSVASQNWTGSLNPFEAEEVVIGSVNPSAATTYSIRITSANDDSSNDEISTSIAPAQILEVGENEKNIYLDLIIDAYASELGVIFNEGSAPSEDHITVHNNAASNPSSVLGFLQVGSLADNVGTWEAWYDVNNEGCHWIMFVDSYGDGINWQKPDAKIEINGSGGSQISVDPGFGSSVTVVFDVEFINDLSVDNADLNNAVKLYPNPATNMFNLALDLGDVRGNSIEVINMQGQQVLIETLNNVSGEQVISIPATSLENGMYIVNLHTTNGIVTKRLSVVK